MFQEIVCKLDDLKRTIATMESCTGGALASEITNNPGASEVLKYSAVTYSNEYKIKMGVSSDIIEKFSVYSMETADEMALNISKFANADYGVGITGKINTSDPANKEGANDVVFVSIYDKTNDNYEKITIQVPHDKNRKEIKELIVENIGLKLIEILDNEKNR